VVLFVDGYAKVSERSGEAPKGGSKRHGGLAIGAVLALVAESYHLDIYSALSYVSSQLLVAALRPDVVRALASWQEDPGKQLRELIQLRLAQENKALLGAKGDEGDSSSLQVVFNGQLLSSEDDEKPLGQMGVRNGSVFCCLVSFTSHTVFEQQMCCFPHHCSVDGGRVVHVLGEKFPNSSRTSCRFGRIVTGATIEDDGTEGGISQLRCVAPPHPAGPVTISVSFDGGITWLEGPTFWYYDPLVCSGTYGVCVPADCGAGAMPVALEQAPLFDQFDSL
ncbi:unnamed protein product, partial [Durusdinium trenchii]